MSRLAPVHRDPGNGLESGLVRPHGLDVCQLVAVCLAVVVVAPQAEAIALVRLALFLLPMAIDGTSERRRGFHPIDLPPEITMVDTELQANK